jgi:hypothetical protein
MNVTSLAAFALATTATALAQCEVQPTATGRGVPSLDDAGTCLCEWDPDGAGPLGPRLVVGGFFTLAGDLPANGIAAFDPATGQWSSLGPFDGLVELVAVLPNGQLVASGSSFTAAGQLVSSLRVWTGSAWSSAIAQPSAFSILALAVAPTGELHAAVQSSNGMEVQRLGSSGWQVLGTASPLPPGTVAAINSLAFAGNGDLVVAGSFSAIDGVAANCVARWNGSAWSPLGSGLVGRVWSLLATSTGALFAGGVFPVGGSPASENIAQWNGTSWQPLGSGTQSTSSPFQAGVFALAEVPGGIVAAGQFDGAGGLPAFKVAHWNGAAWSAMGSGIEQFGTFGGPSIVIALQRTANGELFAAGGFATVGGRDSFGLARWNGTTWSPPRSVGIGRETSAVHRTATGDVYLAGSFRDIDGVACNGIAKRVGTGWQPLGAGLASLDAEPEVVVIRSLPNGDVVAGGAFATIGGAPIPGLARWNGSAWSSLGTGLGFGGGNNAAVLSMHVAANGDLYVAGLFDAAGGVAVDSVARWNGSQWSAVGGGLGSAFVTAVTSSPTGEVYIAGQFAPGAVFPPGNIAVLSGSTWQGIGTADGTVRELIALPGGTLLAAGNFQNIDGQPVGCIARWAGGMWAPFGGLGTTGLVNSVRRLLPLPSGGLLAAGRFPTDTDVASFAQWDGSSWRLSAEGPFEPKDLAFDPSGEVLVAGSFRTIDGVASAYFARVVAPCAATAIAAGSGCTGSGGQSQLAASAAPWLGTTWIGTASGMPSNSLAATVLGLGTTNVPLSSLLPQGGAGCSLLVTPDVLGLALPSGGVAQVQLPLPLVPAFAGIALQLQVAPIEFGVGGAITAVTSTNRLSLTLGIF